MMDPITLQIGSELPTLSFAKPAGDPAVLTLPKILHPITDDWKLPQGMDERPDPGSHDG